MKKDPFLIFSENFQAVCRRYRISSVVAQKLQMLWKEERNAANTMLFERGSHFDKIWFVAEGAIKSTRIVDDVEMVYSLSVTGHYIADYRSFLTELNSKLSFYTITKSTIYTINKDDLEEMYGLYPEANEFGRFLAEYATEFVRQRIIGMQILTLVDRYRLLIKNSPQIVKIMPQQDIAAYLGAQPQSLSRIKRQLFQKEKDVNE